MTPVAFVQRPANRQRTAGEVVLVRVRAPLADQPGTPHPEEVHGPARPRRAARNCIALIDATAWDVEAVNPNILAPVP
jgi:hypothetical protein